MANEGNQFGQENTFKVYSIRSSGHVAAFETAYVLVYVQSFESYAEAEYWISNSGERHLDYTIMEIFRNK